MSTYTKLRHDLLPDIVSMIAQGYSHQEISDHLSLGDRRYVARILSVADQATQDDAHAQHARILELRRLAKAEKAKPRAAKSLWYDFQ